MWRSTFDVDGEKAGAFRIAEAAESIYAKLMPFYTQIHAYFRRQIAAVYKSDATLMRDRPIPAHLLREPNRMFARNYWPQIRVLQAARPATILAPPTRTRNLLIKWKK